MTVYSPGRAMIETKLRSIVAVDMTGAKSQ